MVLMFFITSCDKEVIKIKGKIDGLSDSELILKMDGVSGKNFKIVSSFICENGEFNFELKDIKPPVKLTFLVNDSLESDIWVGEYGSIKIEGKYETVLECQVVGSFFCNELQRMSKNLYEMYIGPIKEKEIKIAHLMMLPDNEKLSEEDEIHLEEFKKSVKTAYRLRKKSILKTVRKNKQNPVAVALMCEEYERLTSHQKKECLKYLSRSFSDTGLNWQMKN